MFYQAWKSWLLWKPSLGSQKTYQYRSKLWVGDRLSSVLVKCVENPWVCVSVNELVTPSHVWPQRAESSQFLFLYWDLEVSPSSAVLTNFLDHSSMLHVTPLPGLQQSSWQSSLSLQATLLTYTMCFPSGHRPLPISCLFPSLCSLLIFEITNISHHLLFQTQYWDFLAFVRYTVQ